MTTLAQQHEAGQAAPTTEPPEVAAIRWACAQEDTVYALSQPFRVGDFVYATDGRVILRIPAPDGYAPTVSGDKRLLDVETAFYPWAEAEAADRPFAADGFLYEFIDDCYACNGTGRTGATPCDHCGGKGHQPCPCCDQDTDCDRCDARGYFGTGTKCLRCNGKKESPLFVIKIDGALVRSHYFDRIAALPDVRLGRVEDPAAPIPFRYDGGTGLVMGLKVGDYDGTTFYPTREEALAKGGAK